MFAAQRPFGIEETHGMLAQPGAKIKACSDGRDWTSLFTSVQREMPFQGVFRSSKDHLLVLHRDGPVQVESLTDRRIGRRVVPAGGIHMIAPGTWSDFYTQRILGTHGELYELADATYDIDGRVTAADLTVTMNLGREDAYEIQINDWKQGDFGIRIENLAWHKGLESGTNKNGILDDWRDLSLDTIRDALAGLGFEAKEISDGSSGQQRQAASNNTTSGLVREGNDAANTLAGTTGDDVFNGARAMTRSAAATGAIPTISAPAMGTTSSSTNPAKAILSASSRGSTRRRSPARWSREAAARGTC